MRELANGTWDRSGARHAKRRRTTKRLQLTNDVRTATGLIPDSQIDVYREVLVLHIRIIVYIKSSDALHTGDSCMT